MVLYCPSCDRKTRHTIMSLPPPPKKKISAWGAVTLGLMKVRCERCGRVSSKS